MDVENPKHWEEWDWVLPKLRYDRPELVFFSCRVCVWAPEVRAATAAAPLEALFSHRMLRGEITPRKLPLHCRAAPTKPTK